MDEGRQIRIGSLALHGPFQDLLEVLKERQTDLTAGLLDMESIEDLALAHREARGFRDAVTFINETVSSLAAKLRDRI